MWQRGVSNPPGCRTGAGAAGFIQENAPRSAWGPARRNVRRQGVPLREARYNAFAPRELAVSVRVGGGSVGEGAERLGGKESADVTYLRARS